jgi:hypothetical protein
MAFQPREPTVLAVTMAGFVYYIAFVIALWNPWMPHGEVLTP